MHPPFRIHPRIVESRQFDNVEQLPLSFADYPAEKLIAQIEANPKPGHELVRLAAAHPDERVSLAAIQCYKNRIWSLGGEVVFERAIRICENENIAWHPIFDAIASIAGWPGGLELKEYPADYRRIHYWTDSLIPWLKEQTDPKQIESLLQFRSDVLLGVVAEHSGVLTDDLVRRLATASPNALSALPYNPHLSNDMADWLAEYAVGCIMRPDDEMAPGVSAYQRTLAVTTVFNRLVEKGYSIRADLIDSLVNALRALPYAEIYSMLWSLDAQLTPDQLRAVIVQIPSDSTHRVDLLNHPSATVELWREALENARGAQLLNVRKTLSFNLRALTDPVVRKQILTTRSESIICNALVTVASADRTLFFEVVEDCVMCAPDVTTKLITNCPTSNWAPWHKRIIEEGLEILVNRVLQSNNVSALKNLVWFESTTNDPRILSAFVCHPKANVSDLLIMVERLQGNNLRHVVRRVATSGTSEQQLSLLERLMRGDVSGASDVTGVHLVPFLSSDDRQVRTQAILAMSVLRGRLEDQPSHGTERSVDSTIPLGR